MTTRTEWAVRMNLLGRPKPFYEPQASRAAAQLFVEAQPWVGVASDWCVVSRVVEVGEWVKE